MSILALLFAFGCLSFVAWLYFFRPQLQLRSPHKNNVHQRPNQQRPERVQPKSLQLHHQTKERFQPTKTKHQHNIELANQILQRLRHKTPTPELPLVLGILRQISPYVFEELLLNCCLDQGWQIQRNFQYTGDGGVDGRVLILGKLYLIQAKRYRGYINPQHLQDFQQVIRNQQANGGFFIHTGKTGSQSRLLLSQFPQITLISGQRLVNFVLGQKLKILGVTM